MSLFCHLCNTKYSRKEIEEKSVSLHCVPLKEERRKLWINNCGTDLPVGARVCNKHFKPDSFRVTGKIRNLMPSALPTRDEVTLFSPLLERSFSSLHEYYTLIEECSTIEEKFTSLFRLSKVRKTSYIYLLIDCSISCNLPERAKHMDPILTWKTFLKSIFYVSRGTANSYIHHFNSAIREKDLTTKNIMMNNIWDSGYGVHVLRWFDNICREDSEVRESVIIKILQENICNEYGGCNAPRLVHCDRLEDVDKMGLSLLNKMMKAFLLQGENPLFPYNFLKE